VVRGEEEGGEVARAGPPAQALAALLAGPRVPEANGALRVLCGQVAAAGGKGHRRDPGRMLQAALLLARRGVPELDRPALAGDGEHAAVRADGGIALLARVQVRREVVPGDCPPGSHGRLAPRAEFAGQPAGGQVPGADRG